MEVRLVDRVRCPKLPLVGIAVWLVACDGQNGHLRDPIVISEPAVVQSVRLLHAERRDRTPMDVADRAAAVGEILAGRHISRPNVDRVRVDRGADPLVLELDGDLVATYSPGHDEVRVARRDLTGDDEAAEVISEPAARGVVGSIVTELKRRSLVDGEFDVENALVRHRRFGMAENDKPASIVTNEFRFSVWQKIDHVDNACVRVRVGVHKSGVASFVALMTACDVRPTAQTVALRVPRTNAEQRFKLDVPGAEHVVWWTAYSPLDDAFQSATLEPRHVVAYTLKTVSDGHEVYSRKQFLSYSATDAHTAPVPVGPVPDPGATGDPR